MANNITTKKEMLNLLREFAQSPDDDNIRFKNKIKKKLLRRPDLLYAFNNTELESELFNKDGSINAEGDWDAYFGPKGNIRPALYIPTTQTEIHHYLCYTTHFNETVRYNDRYKIMEITFYIFCHGSDIIDKSTGIARHDLIASILRRNINWSNWFGGQCRIAEDKEGTTDYDYVMRTITFELEIPDTNIKTTRGNTQMINDFVRV